MLKLWKNIVKANISLVNSRRICSKVSDCDNIQNDPNKKKLCEVIEVSSKYFQLYAYNGLPLTSYNCLIAS